jgi:CDP-glycerol glycerophosphotransferase (TagB/SpsB family)
VIRRASFERVGKRIASRIGPPAWWLLGRVVPKARDLVAVNSYPDFDDTARALARASDELGFKLAVLTAQRNAAPPEWCRSSRITVAHRYSVEGLRLYHSARTVLFTHGLFAHWPLSDRQVVVNVWHGMPIKRIGLMDGKRPEEIPRFHYTIADDDLWRDIVAKSFGGNPRRVIVTAHPRIDIMLSPDPLPEMGLPPRGRLIAWLPTYRRSWVGDIREDGDAASDPLNGGVDLKALDEALRDCDAACVVKPHPMARVDRALFAGLGSIVLLDDDDLRRRGATLYQLLGHTDGLITDVSSVFIDYSRLGRPTLLFCPDLDKYDASRGFSAPLGELVGQEITVDQAALPRRIRKAFREPRRTELARPGDARRRIDATRGFLERIDRMRSTKAGSK